MPLVEMKYRPGTNRDWYPVCFPLAQAMPKLLTDNGDESLLDPETTPGDVQVIYDEFPENSINIPDLWLHIRFTEDPRNHSELELQEVRTKVFDRIDDWINDFQERTKHVYARPWITLDIFWGPGHGCMISQRGVITQSW